MKFVPKTIMLLFVLLMASACSAAFENAGLSGDDAAMLSAALDIDPVGMSYDFDYTVDISVNAEGETIVVKTAGQGIHDQANGNSLLSMAGEVSGIPDMGGASQPYDLEFRTIGETELYIRGVAPLADPSADPNAWIFVDVESTSQMAMAGVPELESSGVVSNGDVDVAAIYEALDTSLFGSAANYVSATRLDDMNGLAHFQVDLAVGDWLSSDELQDGIMTLVPAIAGDTIPEEDLAQAGFAMGMAGMLLSDGTYQFDYLVEPTSGLLAGAKMTIGIMVDPAMMGGEGEPVTFDMVLDVSFKAFGADSTVVAPDEFIDMMQMMGGGN